MLLINKVFILVFIIVLLLTLTIMEYFNIVVKDNSYSHNSMPAKLTSANTIIFTVFLESKERFYIQSQTILNWAHNISLLQPVLFVNNSTVLNTLTVFAKQAGWIIVDDGLETNNYGTPFLKPMFQYALENFNATFYAFANGDMLFDNGLLTTLESIKHDFDITNPLLIVGFRWNFLYYKYQFEAIDPVWTKQGLSNAFKKSGMFQVDAEDYFIVTRNYPWDKIKPVVIGRPGYDNYLVAISNTLGVNTIDATQTVKAVHLNVNGSVYQGARNIDRDYNKNIIGPFDYNTGLIVNSKYLTTFNNTKNTTVCVRKRTA